MSEVYFLGTTKPFKQTVFELKHIIPHIEKDDMLYNDSLRLECDLWQDAVATGVQKILKGCHS